MPNWRVLGRLALANGGIETTRALMLRPHL